MVSAVGSPGIWLGVLGVAVALAVLVVVWISLRRREARRVRDRAGERVGRAFEFGAPVETETRGKVEPASAPAANLGERPGARATGAPAVAEPAAEGGAPPLQVRLPEGIAATARLTLSGAEPAGPVLLELLRDPRPSIRHDAVIALATEGGPRALQGLAQALTRDPAVEVRREAVLGLRSLVRDRPAVPVGRRGV